MPPAIAPALSFVPLVIGTAGPSESDDGFTSSSSLVASVPNNSFMHEVCALSPGTHFQSNSHWH